LADFGVVTLFNTVIGLIAIVFSALASSVTHRVAFLAGKKKIYDGSAFGRRALRLTFVWAFVASVVWVLCDGYIASFFQVNDLILVWFFAPTILFGALASVQSGYLKGRFAFRSLGVAGLVEAVSKFGFALAFMWSGRTDLVSISIPASIAISFLITDWYAGRLGASDDIQEKPYVPVANLTFPNAFFSASLLAGGASAVFLNVDVLVAKHFLSPELAGAYALLSLVGKMIFLFGSLLTTFVNSIVSHHEGAEKDPRHVFARLLKLTVLISLLAYVGVGPLGRWTVPLLLGGKAIAIVPYLNLYGLAMVAFTLSTTLVVYRVARKHYAYAWIQLSSTALMVVGLSFYHASIPSLRM
jgi:O-antigen/teichoic acid export membrane protein